MKIDISEDLGKITVTVEVPPRKFNRDEVIACGYHFVRNLLREKGYDNIDCTTGRGLLISNRDNNKGLKGQWVFQSQSTVVPKQETATKSSKTSPRRKRATKPKPNPTTTSS